MTIDPRVAVYLNLVLAILMALAGATAEFSSLLGQQGSLVAMAIIGILITVINSVLHAIPSKPDDAKAFYLGPKETK